MPEGDSVFRLARRLDRLVGQQVVRSELRHPRWSTHDLAGRRLLVNDTHGKHLLQRFSGDLTVHSHLRMDGEWSITRPGRRLPSRVQHEVRVVVETEVGTLWGLRIHDLVLLSSADEGQVTGRLGPDPLRPDWDADEAVRRVLDQPSTPLVSALLDQTVLAGLGNLWANELAFLTRVSPWTRIGDLGEDEVRQLIIRAATMLRRSATVAELYQVTTGDPRRGRTHWVAGRQHQPCRRCGAVVQAVEALPDDAGNRRTWWCPQCQPGPGPQTRLEARTG